MRALSIQQPFAQLVAQGVKRIEVRPWGTDYRGRVAIHASAAVVPKTIGKRWKEDREMALRFADQGWLDRDDLKALPRSAIIGTVELVAVHLGEEVLHQNTGLFAWNWASDRMELGASDAETGAFLPIKARQRPLPVPMPPDQYAWVFAEPVEIDPITGVDGAQKLWNLVGELEGVIADRETNSRRGWWRPAEVSPARRAKAIRVWKKHWESERERYVQDVERRVGTRHEIARIRFKPEVEERVRDEVAQYIGRNRVAKADGDEPQVLVEGQFKEMFDGRDVVGEAEFELFLRRRLKQEGDEQYAAVRAERRKQELLKLLDELRKGAGPGTVDRDNICERLEATCDKLMEEEDEDYEHVRRLLNPLGEERAKRAAARERAQRDPKVREAARLAARTPEEMRADELRQWHERMWAAYKAHDLKAIWELRPR